MAFFLSQLGKAFFLSQLGMAFFLSQLGMAFFLSQLGMAFFLSQLGKAFFPLLILVLQFVLEAFFFLRDQCNSTLIGKIRRQQITPLLHYILYLWMHSYPHKLLLYLLKEEVSQVTQADVLLLQSLIIKV